MTESEKYKLSTYESVEVLHKTDSAIVELVKCSLDDKMYVKKVYPADKRSVFNIIAKNSSPFLPKIYEVFFGEDTVVIEEYIEGQTLDQLYNEHYSFSPKEVSDIFENILSALSCLHELSIIHRDIKPSNIIIKETGQAVLIDFSIARPYVASNSSDTELLGTIGYAAPEQFGFSQSDYRTDIYALGITLKNLGCLKDVPKRIAKAIERCAEFDPKNRFQSVDEILRYIKQSQRKRAIGILAGIAFIIVVLVFCFNQFFPKEDKTEIVPPQGETNTILPEHSEQTSTPLEQEETSTPNLEDEETSVPKQEIDKEEIPPVHSEELDELLYHPSYSRIVNTSDVGDTVPCLQLWDDRTYKTRVSLGGVVPETLIEVISESGKYTVTINEEDSYVFESTYTPTAYDYPDGRIFAEIIFYDMNEDGIMEIIPILCDARSVLYPNDVDETLLKNYSLGWCIFYDSGTYQLAEGEMIAQYEQFKIYAACPGMLQTDFPSYYKLEEGTLVLVGW